MENYVKKKQLRELMLHKRRMLLNEEVKKASALITNQLISHSLVEKSQNIMSYMPFGNEVDLMVLNRWILERGKKLLIPRVIDKYSMDAVEINSFDKGLKRSKFGILEPGRDLPAYNPLEIDLILVPGVAFDIKGNRLGHGKGYYDRFLELTNPKTFTIGIAYNFQLLQSIPSDNHDKRVRVIATEKQILLPTPEKP